MSGTITVTRGLAADVPRQIYERGMAFVPGTHPSPFLPTDVLTVNVWPGGTLAAVSTPAASWDDAAGLALYTIHFLPADTAGLQTTLYQFLTTAFRGTQPLGEVDKGRLDVRPAPLSGTATLTFTTLADLMVYCPWVEDLQDDETQFSFNDEQVRATNRLIDAVVNLWGYNQPWSEFWPINTGGGAAPSKYLRDLLVPLVPGGPVPPDMAANRRNTTPNIVRPSVSTALLLYDDVLEVCARLALAYVFGAQAGRNDDREWSRLSGVQESKALSLFRSTAFQIDMGVPQTGNAGVTVQGGVGSLR